MDLSIVSMEWGDEGQGHWSSLDLWLTFEPQHGCHDGDADICYGQLWIGGCQQWLQLTCIPACNKSAKCLFQKIIETFELRFAASIAGKVMK